MRTPELNLSPLHLYLVVLSTICISFHPVKASEPTVHVRSGSAYLEILDEAGVFQPFYVKGVNLSGVLPGHQATDPTTSQATYERWFGMIADMNCNTVRVFNTMPDAFYIALSEHNAFNAGHELWLIQGIWAELPADGDFSGAEYSGLIEENIRSAIDAVHGSAGGANVSSWLLAYLFGREWEAPSVVAFNEMQPLLTSYDGEFVCVNNASPMEAWLGQMCDGLVAYEQQTYGWQHPVSFVNWVATDPLDHLQGYKKVLGADFEVPAAAMEDFAVNDAVSLSVNNLSANAAFKAGLFASFHVYPYYPDFIARQPQYARVLDSEGRNSFLGYLNELKAHYPKLPVLITEYGLASSPLAVHRHPQGWHHGGMSEERVADVLPRLTQAVEASGCGGGAVFSWTDGWFKRVWLWNRFYRPADESCLWFNLLDPEQNYGLLALEPASETSSQLAGDSTDWQNATLLTPDNETASQKPQLWAMHDDGYLYLRIDLAEFHDWQFETHRLQIGLNVVGADAGNFAFRSPVNYVSQQSLELLLEFSSGEARLYQASTFRYWPALRRWNTDKPAASVNPVSESNPHGWILPQVQTNSPVLDRTGQVLEAQAWPLNPLRQASLQPGESYDPHATWNASVGSNMLELRLPWMLAGFTAPQRKHVLAIADDGTVGYAVSDGIGVSVVLADLEGDPMQVMHAAKYVWPDWNSDTVSFAERLKPAYFAVQEAYGSSSAIN